MPARPAHQSNAPTQPDDRGGVVKSADRVLDVLELLASTGRAMSHAELARRTGIPKGSLTPLLRNLTQREYVDVASEGTLFLLGEAAYTLPHRGAKSRELIEASLPWLEHLVQITGESAGISVLRDDVAERVAAAQSDKAVFYSLHIGVLQPLYASSAGKILLAWMAVAERERYLSRVHLEARTEKTIRSVTVLRRQLHSIREEGVAWSLGEFTAGIVGVAVPVVDVHGRAVAALGIALPAPRLSDANKLGIVKALRATAKEISRSLSTT